MPRRVQDIIPNSYRSIKNVELKRPSKTQPKVEEKKTENRDIPIHVKTPSREPISDHQITLAPHVVEKHQVHHHPSNDSKRKSRNGLRWILITIGIIVVVTGIGYVASVYFSRATFTLVPRSVAIDINGVYIAQENTSTSTIISYEPIIITSVASTTVPAIVGASISSKAHGTIVLYNSFGTQSQRLIAGTRLTTSDGKLYRLTSSVVVPGYTYSTNKVTVIPGSIQATIIADQPGDIFNINGQGSVSDLTIPAYKGTSKYESIYGRLISNVFGGFIGSKKTIDQNILASTTASLETKIISDSISKARAMVPSSKIMYDTGYTVIFSTSTDSSVLSTSSASLYVSSTMKVFLFKKNSFVSHLVGATTTASFGTFGYDINGLDKLDVKFIPTKTSQVSIRINGPVKLTGVIPVAEIQNKLAGRPITDTQDVIKPYNQVVESITGELMPPWAHVPVDINRISMSVETK